MKNMIIANERKNPLLTIFKNEKILFQIDSEGVVEYTLNGVLKKLDSEKELAIIFSIAIMELNGWNFDNTDELITKVIDNYRNSRIDKIIN